MVTKVYNYYVENYNMIKPYFHSQPESIIGHVEAKLKRYKHRTLSLDLMY